MQIDWLIIVGLCVVQNSPAVFNKAAMMNIAFLEVSKLYPEINCVMFQDADSLAEDDRLLMRCDSRPHHYALTLNRWAYKYVTTTTTTTTTTTHITTATATTNDIDIY